MHYLFYEKYGLAGKADRFYSVQIQEDLLGYFILIDQRGGEGVKTKVTMSPYETMEDALEAISRVVKYRKQHGYKKMD